jgi:hypothetical protein
MGGGSHFARALPSRDPADPDWTSPFNTSADDNILNVVT